MLVGVIVRRRERYPRQITYRDAFEGSFIAWAAYIFLARPGADLVTSAGWLAIYYAG
jgi:hypothetical protein